MVSFLRCRRRVTATSKYLKHFQHIYQIDWWTYFSSHLTTNEVYSKEIIWIKFNENHMPIYDLFGLHVTDLWMKSRRGVIEYIPKNVLPTYCIVFYILTLLSNMVKLRHNFAILIRSNMGRNKKLFIFLYFFSFHVFTFSLGLLESNLM